MRRSGTSHRSATNTYRTLAIHGLTNASGMAKGICLSWFSHQERQQFPAGYFLLPAACLAATACFFFWSALRALDCFCVDFFWLDFGDRSPIILIFFRGLTHLRHVSFSEGTHIVLDRKSVV